MKRTAYTAIGIIAFLAATPALADTEITEFNPSYANPTVQFPWESGYIPSSGPLGINLTAEAGHNVDLTMQGEAHYDHAAKTITFQGAEGGGTMNCEIFAEVGVNVRVDVFGLNTDFDVGLWDFSDPRDMNFTPYLIGSDAELTGGIGPFNLANQPFDIAGVTGTLNLDVSIDVPGIRYTGTSIDVSEMPTSSAMASITDLGQATPLTLPGEPGDTVTVYATQRGTLDAEVAIHFLPTVSIEVFGLEFDVGPFDLEVDYPLVEGQAVAMEAMPLEFTIPADPTPEEPDPEEGDGDGGGDDGGDDAGDDGGDDGEVPGAVDREGSDGGCGCTADANPAPGALFAGLFGLALMSTRRRRRRN